MRPQTCPECEVAYINGVRCHEQGCPKRERECAECGSEFEPSGTLQTCCSPCCAAAYAGHWCTCDECVRDMEPEHEALIGGAS